MNQKNKIGILSMQRIVNYGSFLQAYALKKNIEMITSKEVEFVDYNMGKPLISTRRDLIKKIKQNINIVRFVKKRKYVKKLDREYINQFLPMLNIKEKNIYPKDIESLVIGSDEVFNCLQSYPVGFSPDLFGENYDGISVISYAASFGFVKYEDIVKYELESRLIEDFKKFKSISVRDSNSFDIISKMTQIKPNINLDPVLITSFDDEMKDNVQYNNYVLIYAYSNRLNKRECNVIKKYANENKKIIISIGGYTEIADYNLVVNPFELYGYFKHADLVITDTFHGSIFSIKNHANYYTIVRKSNENKLKDLLIRLKQENRMIKDINQIYNYVENDFTQTNKIIEAEREKTINYLKENL